MNVTAHPLPCERRKVPLQSGGAAQPSQAPALCQTHTPPVISHHLPSERLGRLGSPEYAVESQTCMGSTEVSKKGSPACKCLATWR